MLPLLRFVSGCFNSADAVSLIIPSESKRESMDKFDQSPRPDCVSSFLKIVKQLIELW